MGFPVHRNSDNRICGCVTKVVGQSTVFVNNRLWAVEGDPDRPCGRGALIAATGRSVTIENKFVIVHGPDPAIPDNCCPGHCNPMTNEGSHDTFCY